MFMTKSYLRYCFVIAVVAGSPFLQSRTIGKDFSVKSLDSKKMDNGFIIRAVQETINQIARDFEINDRIESKLLSEVLTMKKTDNSNLSISIVLFRPIGTDLQLKAYEKKFDDRWVLRFTRIPTDRVKLPIAIITIGKVVKKQVLFEEKFLYYEKGKWQPEKVKIKILGINKLPDP